MYFYALTTTWVPILVPYSFPEKFIYQLIICIYTANLIAECIHPLHCSASSSASQNFLKQTL